jgi:hypothetical protein
LSFTGPHAPSGPDCFSTALHASQVAVHAVSQQTPSAQWPEMQSRQPATLQSATTSHAAACALLGTQVLLFEQ